MRNIRFRDVFFTTLLSLILFAFCSCKKKTTPAPPSPPAPPGPVWDPNAMRGVWLTTTASTALDNNDNIQATVNNCKRAGINTIFVVVYNNARTIYPSEVMQKLTGNRQLEKFAGRDPLKELITAAKAAGLKVHAWFEYGFSSSYSAQGRSLLQNPDGQHWIRTEHLL
jgi:uncharacterized lipoprotein YddW (UPF0748 family)